MGELDRVSAFGGAGGDDPVGPQRLVEVPLWLVQLAPVGDTRGVPRRAGG
jgi:hypothetical protein